MLLFEICSKFALKWCITSIYLENFAIFLISDQKCSNPGFSPGKRSKTQNLKKKMTETCYLHQIPSKKVVAAKI